MSYLNKAKLATAKLQLGAGASEKDILERYLLLRGVYVTDEEKENKVEIKSTKTKKEDGRINKSIKEDTTKKKDSVKGTKKAKNVRK